MRLLIFCIIVFQATLCYSQNVKIEIGDFAKKIDGKGYATYQFVNSSYSASRPTLVFITSQAVLLQLTTQIPNLFRIKQEFTDVWVLGIKDFNQTSISSTDQKIIDSFLLKIVKYRNDNDLAPFTFQRLNESKIFINSKDEICKFISCRKRPWQ